MTKVVLAAVAAMLVASSAFAAAPPKKPVAGDPFASSGYTSHLNAGLSAFYSKQFAAARKEFAACLQVVPDDAFCMSLLNAAARNDGPEHLSELANDEEAVVARRPKDALAQTRLAYTYLFQEPLLASRGQDARDALTTALQLDPRLAAAHVGMGIFRLNEESTNRAKVEFLAALRIQPRNVLAREYLATIYLTDLKDPNRALSYLIDVPNVVPGYADAYYYLGSIMDDLGQYDAAIKYLKTAIDLDRGHVGEAGAYALPLLGQVYIKLHKIAEAKQAFAQAIVFGELPEYSQAQLDKIKSGQIK